MTTQEIGRLQRELDAHSVAASIIVERTLQRYQPRLTQSANPATVIVAARHDFQREWELLTADVKRIADQIIEAWIQHERETGVR